MINATRLMDGNISASLTVNRSTTVSGTLDCGFATMSFGNGVESVCTLVVQSNGTSDSGSGTHSIGSLNIITGRQQSSLHRAQHQLIQSQSDPEPGYVVTLKGIEELKQFQKSRSNQQSTNRCDLNPEDIEEEKSELGMEPKLCGMAKWSLLL